MPDHRSERTGRIDKEIKDGIDKDRSSAEYKLVKEYDDENEALEV